MKRCKPWLTVFFGLLVFAWSAHYLWSSFQWRDIGAAMAQVSLIRFLIGAVVTTIVYWALRAWRWQVLLEIMDGGSIRVLPLYMSTACSLAFALVTPFQSGEALKVELLRKHGGLGRFDGYASFAVERFLDLFVVVALALSGVLLDSRWGLNAGLLATVVLLMLAGAALLLFWAKRSSALSQPLREVLARFSRIAARPGRLAFATSLTAAAWLMVALGWAWCLTCTGIVLPPLQAVTLTTGMTLVNVLSFIPGAVGISEAGIAVALEHLGSATTQAQAGALLIRAYGLAAIALGAVHFMVWQRLSLKAATPAGKSA